MIPELLTAQEARKLLRLGKNAIYDLARQRKLEHVKIGGKILFPREAIEKFIRQNTIPAARNYFSMNRFGFRQHPGRRPIEPDHDELTEGINQDSPHYSPPAGKIDHSLTKDNPKNEEGIEP
ncbi:MAG: helix-turn-helix domain-containing protein [Clostridiales bacterium]|jgi:excisionase family DNA binding protein|nr:helix-turn-helix domain-containing protein [Clostridiales bacterium]